MNQKQLKLLLQMVAERKISIDDAVLKFKKAPFEDLFFARPDHHRALRQGIPEVIYGAGKTSGQIIKITQSILENGENNILITRLDSENARIITQTLPLKYFETAKIGIIGDIPSPNGKGKILIATGGTTDIPAAEEAAVTAEFFGNEVQRLYDVGVAGIHRLFASLDDIMSANVIIAVAGMEGALASVIGGIANCPVIALPTSIGYGASFGGIAALLSMLNSCASGVGVVNIDNGFGAGFLASKINHLGGS